jgi:hypothetical protein
VGSWFLLSLQQSPEPLRKRGFSGFLNEKCMQMPPPPLHSAHAKILNYQAPISPDKMTLVWVVLIVSSVCITISFQKKVGNVGTKRDLCSSVFYYFWVQFHLPDHRRGSRTTSIGARLLFSQKYCILASYCVVTILLFISAPTVFVYNYTILYITTCFGSFGHYQVIYVCTFTFDFLLFFYLHSGSNNTVLCANGPYVKLY